MIVTNALRRKRNANLPFGCWWYAAAGMAMLNLLWYQAYSYSHAPTRTAFTPTTTWVVLCAVLGTIAAM